MFKLKHKTLLHLTWLAAAAVLLCCLFVFWNAPFGSKVDWISQHSVLPDYFRQRFYETKDLFPDFAANIGGGQNIYNFAYYGLFSPVILLSYLLPFIPMDLYIMGTAILCLATSAMLLYSWLSSKYSSHISLTVSFVFLLASPMIYHSYNQLMFVNYMPFLLMALTGTDHYFKKKQSRLMTAGIFLMILTSFYFSIGGILAVLLYGIFTYLKLHTSVTIKQFFKDGLCFICPVMFAVLLSSFYLLPLFMTLTASRFVQTPWSLLDLLLPDLPVTRLLYSPYGLGLTALALTALLFGLWNRGAFRILSASLLVFLCIPLFGCILNGGLYLKDKAFLPLLPLFCLLIAEFLHRLKYMGKNWHPFFICYLITLIYLIILHGSTSQTGKYGLFMIADAFISLLCFFIYVRIRRLSVITIGLLILMVPLGYTINTEANMKLNPSFYKKITAQSTAETITDIQNEGEGLYRTEQYGSPDENAANLNRIHTDSQWITSIYSSLYNKYYMDFRVKTFGLNQPFRNCLMQSATANPVFLNFMGVKYIVDSDANTHITENPAPVFYATSQYMTEASYRSLSFPYNQTALLSYAVLPGTKAGKASVSIPPLTKLKSSDFSLPAITREGTDIRRTSDGYHLRLSEKMTVDIPLPKEVQNADTVFLRFHIENKRKNKDVAITVENERNKLTAVGHPYYNNNKNFTYVCQIKEGQETLTVKLGAGDYTISSIEYFAGSSTDYSNPQLYEDIFQMDKEKSKGDTISGKIICQNKGYFITSLPYDKGYHVLVDGRKVSAEKVNTAFVGFPLDKGKHEISITYEAAGAKAGRLLTIAAIFLSLFLRCFISAFPGGNGR